MINNSLDVSIYLAGFWGTAAILLCAWDGYKTLVEWWKSP